MNKPLAVVFQKADGGTHEMWVPPGFAVVMANGGILVTHEEHMVTTLLSVRPLQGEVHADQVHEHSEGAEDRVGERGREPDGVVLGAEAGVGDGPGEGPAEGSGVPGDDDGGDPSEWCVECGKSYPELCPAHASQRWPDYASGRTPGPDDVPGVTV